MSAVATFALATLALSSTGAFGFRAKASSTTVSWLRASSDYGSLIQDRDDGLIRDHLRLLGVL